MSIERRLVHRLAILRQVTDDDGHGHPLLDDMGQPVRTSQVLSELPGLVQPRRTREVAATSGAGPAVSDHVIYVMPTDVTTADVVRMASDDGRRWEITGVRSYVGYGRSDHLELDARLVQASSPGGS